MTVGKPKMFSVTRCNDSHDDAVDVLSDVAVWQLDLLRWQLVGQGLGAIE